MKIHNKTKITSTITTTCIIALLMITPNTILQAGAMNSQNTPEEIQVVLDNPPTKLSQSDLVKLENMVTSDPQVKGIMNGKHYQIMAQDFSENYKTNPGVWSPGIHINVDNVTQISVISDPTITHVTKVSVSPIVKLSMAKHKSSGADPHAFAMDYYNGNTGGVNGLRMTSTAPSLTNTANSGLYFGVNAIESGGSDANACTSSDAATDYFAQSGFFFYTDGASHSQGETVYTDTVNSCAVIDDSSVGYTAGHVYDMYVYVASGSSEWFIEQVDRSGGSLNLYMHTPNHNTMKTSDGNTSVFFENMNTSTTNNWNNIFSTIKATAALSTNSGSSWANWDAETQEVLDCHKMDHFTQNVITGSLDSGSQATWTTANMVSYNAC